MVLRRAAILIPFLWTSQVAPVGTAVQWGPCPTEGPEAANYANATAPIECGTFSVPLDYTQSNSSLVHHKLVKITAKEQPPKGTIQMNFGGPGVGAISTMITQGDVYQALSGGVYDLVAFDPRGVSAELPFRCVVDNTTALTMAHIGSLDASISEREARVGWAQAKAVTGLCQYEGAGNETGEYIGTVAMVRDMLSIAEALDADGMIRYWGFSYGTTLGSTIASMFPEKVDRMILDGIQNPHQYYRGWTDSELWTLTDTVVYYFFASCVEAGADFCPLAALNKSAVELASDFFTFVDSITQAPFALPTLSTVVDGVIIKSLVFQQTYDTRGWPKFAATLGKVIYGSIAEREATLTELSSAAPGGDPGVTRDANLGIHCGDRIPRTDSYDTIAPFLREEYNVSYIVGGLNAFIQEICAQWPWKAKEIYDGEFKAKTQHPILIMGNSLDA